MNVISIFQTNFNICIGSFLPYDSKYCQTKRMFFLTMHVLSVFSIYSFHTSQKAQY